MPSYLSPLTSYVYRMDDAPDTPIKITWKPSGPFVIEGVVVIYDNAGDVVEQPPPKHPGQVKLCGCGLSRTRPFCDGSHKR